MSPRLTWRNLVPGLIALGLIVVVTVLMIRYGGVGRLRGDKVRINVLANQAGGLINGSDVWLGGQRVGTVVGMGFLPPSADSARRLVIELDVLDDEASRIRRNSIVRIRAGANVIGPIIVDVTPGTPNAAPVHDGDTLVAQSQSDFQLASAKLAFATNDIGPLYTDAKAVVRQLSDTNGSIGALREEARGVSASIAELRATFARFGSGGARADSGATASTVRARARLAMARADSIRALLASPTTSYGRWRRDSTLARSIAGVRDELASLGAVMRDSGGTMNRLSTDSALVRAVASARREMAELFADVRRRPMRYIAF